jgi:hypothetical protein
VKQKIQTKRLAISNVGKDSGKPTKMAAWEQATNRMKPSVVEVVYNGFEPSHLDRKQGEGRHKQRIYLGF